MLSKFQFNLLTAASAVVLGLVVFNTVISTQNRDSQLDLAKRQQFVQQTMQLENLYREFVKSLAELAIKNDDKEIINMLASQGVNITSKPPAVADSPAQVKKAGK